jgi:hypothetical protein
MADGRKPAWELEQEACAVSATDWEPLAGMGKRRCLPVRRPVRREGRGGGEPATCPNCAPLQTRKRANNSEDLIRAKKKAAGKSDG